MKEIIHFDALPATTYMVLIYLTATIISIGGIFLLNRFFRLAAFYNERYNKLIKGEPTFLVLDGKPLLKNLQFENISLQELKDSLHAQGIDEIRLVKYVIKETSGQISIIKEDGKEAPGSIPNAMKVALSA